MKTTIPSISINIFSIDKCKNTPQYLFVFGDNRIRMGLGGQAQIRNCLNAIGIATKNNIADPMNDGDYEENIKSIDKDIEAIKEKAKKGKYSMIVFPEQGLGWGRGRMQIYCPKTALYLSTRLLEEFDYNNIKNLESKNF